MNPLAESHRLLMAELDALASTAGGADDRLRRRVAEHGERLAGLVRRCDELLSQGRRIEAIALAEDAGGIVRQATELARRLALQAPLGPAGGGIDPAALERLNLAYVAADAQAAAWRDLRGVSLAAAAGRGDALVRLAALDRLRDLDPRNPSIPRQVDLVEAVAVASLEAQSFAAGDDLAALLRIRDAVRGRSWVASLPASLARGLSERIRRLQVRADHAEAATLAGRIHEAFAAMDRETLERLEALWRERGASGRGGDPASQALVEGAFAWLEAARSRESLDLEAAQAAADLELALDGDLPIGEVEAIASRSARTGRPLPPRLEMRLEARRERETQERRRRQRRRTALAAAALLLAVSIAVASMLELSRKRDHESLAAQLDALVEGGDLDAAATLLAAIEAEPPTPPRVFTAAANTLAASQERAATRVQERLDRAAARRDRLAAIAAAIADPRAPDPMLEEALRGLAAAAAGADPAELAEIRERETLVRSRLADRRLAESARFRSLLAERERAAAALPQPSPQAIPTQLAEAVAQVESLAAQLRSDLDSARLEDAERGAADSLLDRLEARRQALLRRIESRQAFEQRLAAIDRLDADEAAFAAALQELLAAHGDLLAALGTLDAFEAAADTANAALAVKEWREGVSRLCRVSSPPTDPWHPVDRAASRSIARALEEHLRAHRDTPHAAAAEALRGHALALADLPDSSENEASLLRRRLQASGFVDLHRVPLAGGGFLYRRPSDSRDPFDRAILSEGDLRVAPNLLARWPAPSAAAAAGVEETMPSQMLRRWLPRIEAAEASDAAATMLDAIADAAAAPDADPLLQLAFVRSLWGVLQDLPGPGVSRGGAWLEDLRLGRHGDLAVDWARRGPEGRQQLAEVRRRAARALAEAPSAADAAAERRRWWEDLRARLEPMAPAGTMRPGDAAWRVLGPVRPGVEAWVLVRGDAGRGFAFAPLRFDDGAPLVDGPPPPAAPHQVFVR